MTGCPPRNGPVTHLASSSQSVVSSEIHGLDGSGGERNGSYSRCCSVYPSKLLFLQRHQSSPPGSRKVSPLYRAEGARMWTARHHWVWPRALLEVLKLWPELHPGLKKAMKTGAAALTSPPLWTFSVDVCLTAAARR